jgi:Coenzyme PQQ synthesis protein D (PqqD)
MITLEHQVRPHPEVVDTQLEGNETVLLHLQSKLYYSLNPTGTRIWQGLKEDLTLREISERLQEEFEVDAEKANLSVLNLADELCRMQLAQFKQE